MNDTQKLDHTWLKLVDEVMTSEALEEQIEIQMKAHQSSTADLEKTLEIPNFGESDFSLDLPHDMPHLFQLIQHLKSAEKYYPQVEVDVVLAPSPATRLPLIGGVWKKIRHLAHELVIFYVNRFVTHQTHINYHMINSLIELTDLNIKLTREVQSLKAELGDNLNPEEKV